MATVTNDIIVPLDILPQLWKGELVIPVVRHPRLHAVPKIDLGIPCCWSRSRGEFDERFGC
ncbi:hypothetical protein JCM24511_07395 [Saitozyma sp. JCM 24511]|nr:hypothetical protein JCM24511_07395 [Saitozyma sp. JCM 24511]